MRWAWVFSTLYHMHRCQPEDSVHHLAKCQWSVWVYLPCYNCDFGSLVLVKFCLPPLVPSTLKQESRWQRLSLLGQQKAWRVGIWLHFSCEELLKLLCLSLRRGEDWQVGRREKEKVVWVPAQEAAGRRFLKADPPALLKPSVAWFLVLFFGFVYFFFKFVFLWFFCCWFFVVFFFVGEQFVLSTLHLLSFPSIILNYVLSESGAFSFLYF